MPLERYAKKDLTLAVTSYLVACFIGGQSSYLLSLYFRPPEFAAPLQTWLVSSAFMGAITAISCLGGLLGVLFALGIHKRSIAFAVTLAVLAGLGASAIFLLLESITEEDHLVFHGIVVAALSLLVAFASWMRSETRFFKTHFLS